MKEYDIIVAGGGISGAVAAIASARLGKRVLIIEQYGCLGGMLTVGGVGPMMSFHAGETQVVKGITHELIMRLKARGKSTGHIFDTSGYTYTVTPFDAEGMKFELEQMFLEAGGEILYHATISKAATQGNRLTEITVTTKSISFPLTAKVFVDATGDANLAFLSGVPVTKGRPGDGASQPMTMNMKMSNVNIGAIKDYVKSHPEDFKRINHDITIIDRACRLSLGGFELTYEQARKNGTVSFERGELLMFETNNPGELIINTSRIPLPDSTDPWTLSEAEIIGRKQAHELEKFLIGQIPGFENALLLQTGPTQVGVRSSRQIVGLHTLTHEELLSGIVFEDTIAHGGYPIDIHPPTNGYDAASLKMVEEKQELPYGFTYSIPYRSLINDTIVNLITVGRCISTTFFAQGAIRVSPIAGAVGHAGGVAAALCDGDATQVCPNALREALLQQDAFLIPLSH